MGPPIVRWLRWQPTGLGPYETIRARLMSRVLLVMVVLVGIQVPLQLMLPSNALVALLPAAIVALFCAALGLLWSGRQQLAAMLVVGGAIATVALIVFPLGGLRGSATLHVMVGALLAVTWLDPKPAAVAVAINVGVLGGVWAVGPPSPELRVFSPGHELRLAMVVSQMFAVILVTGLVDATTSALQAISARAEHRAAEAARAAERAIQASEAKARFLATMSHELRTPLNAILGYAELLRDDGGPTVADLERIETAGHQLLDLVNDVLEMVRADRAPRAARIEPVDLRAVVDERAATLLTRAGTTSRVVVTAGGALVVATDRAHVRRIVDLLLTNAARQTEDGWVVVELSRDPAEVRIAVKDGGPMIPSRHLPLLFESFVQNGPADRAELGVALCQRLATQLGGKIEVSNGEGPGATFTLHLPAAG